MNKVKIHIIIFFILCWAGCNYQTDIDNLLNEFEKIVSKHQELNLIAENGESDVIEKIIDVQKEFAEYLEKLEKLYNNKQMQKHQAEKYLKILKKF